MRKVIYFNLSPYQHLSALPNGLMDWILKCSFLCIADIIFLYIGTHLSSSQQRIKLDWAQSYHLASHHCSSTVNIWWRHRVKCVRLIGVSLDLQTDAMKYLVSTWTVWDKMKGCWENAFPKHKLQWILAYSESCHLAHMNMQQHVPPLCQSQFYIILLFWFIISNLWKDFIWNNNNNKSPFSHIAPTDILISGWIAFF